MRQHGIRRQLIPALLALVSISCGSAAREPAISVFTLPAHTLLRQSRRQPSLLAPISSIACKPERQACKLS